MMKVKIAIVLLLLGILCFPQAASADDLFYSGDIVTESIGINIDIEDEATVNAVFLLKNRGTEEVEVQLEFAEPAESLQVDGEELENPVVFNPGERKSINATFKPDIEGETTRTLNFDPEPLFNGIPNSEPAGTIIIEALLPEGVSGVAWASQEADEESLEGGRKLYSWESINLYPVPLSLKWSTLGYDLSVEKSASPLQITQQDQVIDIEITVANNGDTELSNISLVDQYVVADFEGVEPLDEFGNEENILFWEKNISLLGPEETVTLSYSVKYITSIPQIYEFDLNPSIVTVDGYLVSVSNKVRMKQSVEIAASSPGTETAAQPQTTVKPQKTPGPEDDESDDYTLALIIGGIIVFLVITGFAGYYVRRRRHVE